MTVFFWRVDLKNFAQHAPQRSLLGTTVEYAPQTNGLIHVFFSTLGALAHARHTQAEAVQFHPHGGQSDFVWLSARTPHGVYVW